MASGVTMEAASVEDEEIRFHVYVYNVQPGIEIDYQQEKAGKEQNLKIRKMLRPIPHVINTNTRKFHRPHLATGCGGYKAKKQKRNYR